NRTCSEIKQIQRVNSQENSGGHADRTPEIFEGLERKTRQIFVKNCRARGKQRVVYSFTGQESSSGRADRTTELFTGSFNMPFQLLYIFFSQNQSLPKNHRNTQNLFQIQF